MPGAIQDLETIRANETDFQLMGESPYRVENSLAGNFVRQNV